jgi:hypothetical protein
MSDEAVTPGPEVIPEAAPVPIEPPPAIEPAIPAEPVAAPAVDPDEAPVVNPFFNKTWPTGAPQ